MGGNLIKKIKQARGITLVALVVTIIILLILAGISIATLTGENSVLKVSKDTAKSVQIDDDIERLRMYHVKSEGKSKLGDITINNSEFGRYAGEVQVAKIDLPADSRVNTVARITDTDILLLEYIGSNQAFTFRFV